MQYHGSWSEIFFFFCWDQVLDLVRPSYVENVRAQTPEYVFGLEAGRRKQEGKMPQMMHGPTRLPGSPGLVLD